MAKNIIVIIILCLTITSKSFGIERYSKGDSLSIWADKLNLRKTGNQDSKIINQISKGNWIVALESKDDQHEDQQLFKSENNWKDLIAGKYVKVKFGNQIEYIFDAYLSKYNLAEIKGTNEIISIDTIKNPDYEVYTREVLKNGIIRENGRGIEWSKLFYLIPDISLEEAILLIKKECIDFKYENGKEIWNINKEKEKIEMEETDGINWRKLSIMRFENYTMINFEDGV